jgi:hypothetical protein
LFGGVVVWVLEMLPWLRASKIVSPEWNICSELYGVAPDFRILPGAFDPATPADLTIPHDEVGLAHLRSTRALSVLGGDFDYAHELWTSYFRVPERTARRADAVGMPGDVIGVHYRGTDKNRAPWDTNPVDVDDMLRLVADFVRARPAPEAVFVATDEARFLDRVRAEVDVPVISAGAGAHHYDRRDPGSTREADDAVLDCVLLSRCRSVIHSSSALSAFAKVLNPRLDSYRVAASKLFTNVPYYPIAYIPRLTSDDPACRAILERQMADDWTENAEAVAKFGEPFGARCRELHNLYPL